MISPDKLESRRIKSGYYNMICPICGKAFHCKPSKLQKTKQGYGFTCSRVCSAKIRQQALKGEGNHQYGKRGRNNASFLAGTRKLKNNTVREMMIYVGEWHKKSASGRVKEHRYLVEQNHSLFGDEKFELIDGWYYLKDGYVVHHIDHNHNNNSIDNLCVVSKSEHVRIHNLAHPRPRDAKGKFIK